MPRQPTTDNRQRYSRRLEWKSPLNRLALAREKRGRDLLDLTESNPTRAGIDYPLDELAAEMERTARLPYAPQPLGMWSAREAVAATLGCDAEDIVITASTSEAYAFLFKLLCDANDEVLVASPSYPLLDQISALELVALRSFPLQYHGRWEIHDERVREALTDRVRALVMVNPNNPTGSFVTTGEIEALASLSLPVISDEVFLDYPLEGRGGTLARDDVLGFTLGGLSKSAALPHYKLAWIRVSGPPRERREALAALALIADNFLSVATPVQAALPRILEIAPRIRASISARLVRNLHALDRALAALPAIQRLPVEGGWYAILRIPDLESDEDVAVRLVEQHGVYVHPGYLFDFSGEGYLVISLLTEPPVFDEGIARMMTTMKDER